MKHFYLTTMVLMSFLIVGIIRAQPSLSSLNIPSDGDSYTVFTNNNLSASVTAGDPGANQTWDFSSIDPGSSSALDYSNATSQDYSDASIKFETQGSANYFDVQNGALTYYGFSTTNATSNYVDGQDQVQFPMSFNDSYIDMFEGTYNAFGQTFDRTGNLNVTVDGYGTLSTPQGTYSDVLRIQIIRSSTDEMNGQTTSSNLDTIYFWYNEHTPHPIMTYTINYVDGSASGQFANYIADNDVILSTEEHNIEVNAYPNPAKELLNINASERIHEVVIYDLNGSAVLTQQPQSKMFTINVQQFDRGQYFYALKNDAGELLSRKKLSVQ
ncbi:MAG: T9SS type A sorting domain-containing protein [Bacteroidota bacterium]